MHSNAQRVIVPVVMLGVLTVAAGTMLVSAQGGAPVVPDNSSADANPEAMGIHYGVEPSSTGISKEQAIHVATDHVGHMAAQASRISARHVLLTDDQRFTEDASGQKRYLVQHLPAWIVTFEGVTFQGRGHLRRADGHTVPSQANHEVTVSVNSLTGEYIMLYT